LKFTIQRGCHLELFTEIDVLNVEAQYRVRCNA